MEWESLCATRTRQFARINLTLPKIDRAIIKIDRAIIHLTRTHGLRFAVPNDLNMIHFTQSAYRMPSVSVGMGMDLKT